MKLTITVRGLMDQVVISTLPKSFVQKVFKHCMGKNNTPYFANNCFKGVLYFDWELAQKFAEKVGHAYTTWSDEDKYYHRTAYCFDNDLEMNAQLDGAVTSLTVSTLDTRVNRLDLDSFLPKITDDEVVILMGSVDTGSESFVLEGVEGAFDPEKLCVDIDNFEDFFLDDMLITGMRYDGKDMERVLGESRGKHMITPVLFSKQGKELDLYDFM
ncbi:MAG: hypothetical protein AB7E47_01620 [Desulfovibrionaceae bacterium]